MINIHDKIWAVKAVGRDGLAYMCPYNVKRDGTPDSATLKMMKTGHGWADSSDSYNYVKGEDGQYLRDANGHYVTELVRGGQVGEAAVYENVPMKGFKVGQDATRWTTENKVFRLHDPRGFTVEIPTGNLSTLIQSCTIINGEIQEECVWGRDGCHILLPINAPEYNRVVKEITRVEEALKLKDLVPGDYVKLHQHGQESYSERQFVGMVKLEWTQHRELFDRVRDPSKAYSYYSSWYNTHDVNIRDDGSETLQDAQWVGLFLDSKCTKREPKYPDKPHSYEYNEEYAMGVSMENSSIKIVSRRSGELAPEHQDIDALLSVMHYYYKGRQDCPDRVVKRFEKQETNFRNMREHEKKDAIRVKYTAKVYKQA